MQTKLIAILVVQLWLGATHPLWAQSSMAPGLGLPSLGPSAGTMRGTRGFDEDLVYVRDVFGKPSDVSRVFVLSGGGLTARMTPHISALFAPGGNSLRFWRGAFRIVVSF